MAHEKAKVYFDGSHYIGIPYVPNPNAKKSGARNDGNEEKKKADGANV